MELGSVRDASLSTQAFEILKNAIFTGKLMPGEPLRELVLARALKVSQATIREALFQLEQIGLVVREPNRGTRVKRLSREEFIHRFAIRIELEGMAMIEAAPRLNEEDFAVLERLAEEAEREANRNDYLKSGQADLRFHQYVWDRSGNPILSQTLNQLTAALFVFSLRIYREAQRQLSPGASPHQELVDALRTGDPNTIRKAIRQHTDAHYNRFLEADSRGIGPS
jgi:DNA-binding GntR family transcriptional regulator